MPPTTTIRAERPDDVPAIANVTERAFRTHPHSSHTEQFVIAALRRAGALSVSLVVEHDGEVVGHVAFSPVQITDGSTNWYGLGPLAVAPERQRQGIGRTLVDAGLAALQQLGARGCVVLGDPAYYARFGFRSRPDCTLAGFHGEHFQCLPFGPHAATGAVTYHGAFEAQD